MKINVKKSYIEYLNHIQIPSFIYYYETNRILGMNQLSMNILGKDVRNIKDIFNIRPKLSKKTLQNGSLILYNQEVNSKQGPCTIDIEINVITLDEKHMCIAFFEHSYKRNFEKHLEWEVPRIYWKNKEQLYLGMNESFKNDFSITLTNEEIRNNDFANPNFLEEDLLHKFKEEEIRVIKGREPLYEQLEMVKLNNNENVLILDSKVPFFNKNGTVIGLIGTYHLVLENVEFKRRYKTALEENNRMYQNQVAMNEFYVKLLKISQLPMDYHLIIDELSDAIVKRFHIDYINIDRYTGKGKEIKHFYSWNNKGKVPGKIKEETTLFRFITRELDKNELIKINSGEEGEKYKKILNYNKLSGVVIFDLNLREVDRYVISFGDSQERRWSSKLTYFLKDITLLYKNVCDRYILEEEIK